MAHQPCSRFFIVSKRITITRDLYAREIQAAALIYRTLELLNISSRASIKKANF